MTTQTQTESRLIPVYELLLDVARDIEAQSQFMTPVIADFEEQFEDMQDTATVYQIEGASPVLSERHNHTMRELSHIMNASASMIIELVKDEMIDKEDEPILHALCYQYLTLAAYIDYSIQTLAEESDK